MTLEHCPWVYYMIKSHVGPLWSLLGTHRVKKGPFGPKHKKQVKANLKVVTMDMYRNNPILLPGKKVCMSCAARCFFGIFSELVHQIMIMFFSLAEWLSCANFDRSHDRSAIILNFGPFGPSKRDI